MVGQAIIRVAKANQQVACYNLEGLMESLKVSQSVKDYCIHRAQYFGSRVAA